MKYSIAKALFSIILIGSDNRPPIPPSNCCGQEHCITASDVEITESLALMGDKNSLEKLQISEDFCENTSRRNWLIFQGVTGTAFDAINASVESESYDDSDLRLALLFRAASLGSIDGMIDLADEYSKIKGESYALAAKYWRIRAKICQGESVADQLDLEASQFSCESDLEIRSAIIKIGGKITIENK